MRLREIRRFVGIHELPIGIGTGLVLCAIAAVLLFHEGVKRGAADQRVRDLASEKVHVDKLIAQHAAEVKRQKAITLAAVAAADSASHLRNISRTAFELRGDTARTAGATQILLPEIAAFIRATDAAGPMEANARAEQAKAIQKLDTLEADHVSRELIDDEQVRILERQAHPRCGVKCGALIGAGAALLVVRAVAFLL